MGLQGRWQEGRRDVAGRRSKKEKVKSKNEEWVFSINCCIIVSCTLWELGGLILLAIIIYLPANCFSLQLFFSVTLTH